MRYAKLENTRRCENCDIDVHRASYAKNLGRKNHLDKMRQDETMMPERLYKDEQTPLKRKNKKFI